MNYKKWVTKTRHNSQTNYTLKLSLSINTRYNLLIVRSERNRSLSFRISQLFPSKTSREVEFKNKIKMSFRWEIYKCFVGKNIKIIILYQVSLSKISNTNNYSLEIKIFLFFIRRYRYSDFSFTRSRNV